MVLLSSLVLVTLSVQEPKVTLRLPATSAEKIVESVAATAQRKITIASQLRETPLVVSVHDVPIAEFVENMALALDAGFETTPDGFKITRSSKWEAEKRREDLATSEADWTKLLQKWGSVLTQKPWTAEGAKALIEAETNRYSGSAPDRSRTRSTPSFGTMTPAARLLYRTLALIGPAGLAQMEHGNPVVLSRYPTRMQVAMPAGFEQVLQTYERETAVNPPPPAEILDDEDGDSYVYRPTLVTLSGGIGKVLISSSDGYFSITICNRQATAFDSANAPNEYEFETDDDGDDDERFLDLEPIKPSALSAELIAYCDRSNNRYDEDTDGSLPQPSPALRAFMLAPEKTDPLSLLPSEVLLAYADQKKLNLIAQFEDYYAETSILLPDEGGRDEIDMTEAMDSLLGYDPTYEKSPGWFIYHPVLRTDYPAPRSALGKYTRDALKYGYTFEGDLELCRVAAEMGMTEMFNMDNPVDMYRNEIQGSHRLPDVLPGAFLAALSPVQRNQLATRGMTVANLTPPQRDKLNRWVFDPDAGVADSVVRPDDSEDADGGNSPLASEITELLPNGVPSNTQMNIVRQDQGGYSVTGAQNALTPRALAAGYLLSQRKSQTDDQEEEAMLYMSRMVVRQVTVTRLTLNLQFSPTLHVATSFDYMNPVPNTQAVAFAQIERLPEMKRLVAQLRNLSDDELQKMVYDYSLPVEGY